MRIAPALFTGIHGKTVWSGVDTLPFIVGKRPILFSSFKKPFNAKSSDFPSLCTLYMLLFYEIAHTALKVPGKCAWVSGWVTERVWAPYDDIWTSLYHVITRLQSWSYAHIYLKTPIEALSRDLYLRLPFHGVKLPDVLSDGLNCTSVFPGSPLGLALRTFSYSEETLMYFMETLGCWWSCPRGVGTGKRPW